MDSAHPGPQALGPTHPPAQLPKLWPAPHPGPPPPPLPLYWAEGCPVATKRGGDAPRGEKMALCAQGLHHLARFCPGRCTPFLTFLDHRLVQEAHSRIIHGLPIGEAVVRVRVDLVSFRFPSPRCPWSPSCLLRPTMCTTVGSPGVGPGFAEARHHLCGRSGPWAPHRAVPEGSFEP